MQNDSCNAQLIIAFAYFFPLFQRGVMHFATYRCPLALFYKHFHLDLDLFCISSLFLFIHLLFAVSEM